MQRAADAVMGGRKLKTVARELDICHTTLQRYVKKLRSGLTPEVGYKSRVVFNEEQETLLSSYIRKALLFTLVFSQKKFGSLHINVLLNLMFKTFPHLGTKMAKPVRIG